MQPRKESENHKEHLIKINADPYFKTSFFLVNT